MVKINMMRQILIALSWACLLNFSPICRAAYAAAEPEVVDGVAAVVNGDVITFSQVRGLVGPREKLLRAQFSGDDLIKKVKKPIQADIQDLINRQIIIKA